MYHNYIRKALNVLIAFGIVTFLTNVAAAQTRIGLHVTQEELNIWKQRAQSGPYRVAGDVSSNSPGDWNRIVANKNSFMSNPSSDLWDGYTGSGCVPAFEAAEPNHVGMNIRDAAFFSLVENDASVRNQVRTILLTQAAKPGVDFSNESKWCWQNDDQTRLKDRNPAFQYAEWITRLLYGYDYIRHHLSSGDRQVLDTWFSNAGFYFRMNGTLNDIKDVYDNSVTKWENGQLGNNGIAAGNNCGGSWGKTHLNGHDICDLGTKFNNRKAQMVGLYGAVGIMLGDEKMKLWAKRWFKEWMKYYVYPDSLLNETHRAFDDNQNAGHAWTYTGASFGRMLDLADLFARAGDRELYNFTTSEGIGPTAGGSKSIRLAGEFFRKTSEGELIIYKHGTSASVENLIDGVWYSTNTYYAYDSYLAKGNVFWNDSAVKAAYLVPGAKNKQGMQNVRDPDYNWMGTGKTHPGLLFMFGQMEGKVSPYPGTAVSPPPPSSSSNPNPIGHWKFDEGSGTIANDSSGTGNHATLMNGAGWTTGRSGSSVYFDGLDDFVKIATTNFSTTEGTFATWIKAHSYKSNEQYIFGHTSIPAYGSRLQLYTDDSSGYLDLGFGDSHTSGLNIQQLKVNTWHHVVLTWNSGTYVVYVDGVQKSTGSYSGLTVLNSYAHIGGVGLDSNPESWAGAIDEVKIWNRALSGTDVQNEFSAQQLLPPTPPSNVVAQPAVQ